MNFIKKNIFILFLLLISSGIYSQDYFLKTNVLGPLVKQPFSIGFEINKKTPNSFVFNIEGGWYSRNKGYDFEQLDWTSRIIGMGFIPEYRYYFNYRSSLNRPVGLFAGGYLVARYFDYKQDFKFSEFEDVVEYNYAGGAGALFGYKYKKPYSKFYAEALLGIGLGYIEIVNYESDFLNDQYLLSRIEISVGYAFQ